MNRSCTVSNILSLSTKTRSSAIEEGPCDALCRLKSCQLVIADICKYQLQTNLLDVKINNNILLQQSLNGNPFARIIVFNHIFTREWRVESGKIFIIHCHPISQPCCPPPKTAHCNYCMIACCQ